MATNKPALPRSPASDLTRVDAHVVQQSEYEDLPELDEDMLARVQLRQDGRPVSPTPRNGPSTVL